MRLSAGPSYDIVLAGDSRVEVDLSPSVISKLVGNKQVLNFGFGGVPLTGAFCERLPGCLSPRGARTLLFGIAPGEFKTAQDRLNDFLDGQVQVSERLLRFEAVNRFLDSIRPVRPSDLYWVFSSIPVPRVRFEQRWADGWLAMDATSFEGDASTDAYRTGYMEEPVLASRVAGFLGRVRAWHEEGIQVCGVRLPIDARLQAVEDRFSGFDWTSFKTRFARSGGVWLGGLSETSSETIDGSHLCRRAAIRYSGQLARVLATTLARPRLGNREQVETLQSERSKP